MLQTLRSFRSIIIMSSGFLFAVGSIFVMYTLLPVVFTEVWGTQIAGIAIMFMTMLQIFLFGPLAANLVDTYGSKKILFAYIGFFIIGGILRYCSYFVDDMVWKSSILIVMILFFAAGFGCKFVDVYVLRTSSASQSGLAFGILVSLAGLGRFIGTFIQSGLIERSLEVYAPPLLIICMLIFAISLIFVPSDLEPNPAILFNKRGVEDRVKNSLLSVFGTYKKSFTSGWRFIQRCRQFPLIPLTISFFEGMFFGSMWFIIPLYLASHPDFLSVGLELGIYEVISLLFAVLCGYIADRGNSIVNVVIGWIGILIGVGILYFHPTVEFLVIIGVIIGLSKSLLYATGQHILSVNNVDHAHDGAYAQTRNIISNIGYMFMPVFWGLLISIDFALILKLFSSMMAMIAMIGLIVAFYLLVFREHQQHRL